MFEAITFILGLVISWILFTKDSRRERYLSKTNIYNELSKKLSYLYLLRIKNDKNPNQYYEEYSKLYIEYSEFVLTNKFTISEKVNDLSIRFLSSFKEDKETMMSHLNDVLNQMMRELGLNVIDFMNQSIRIEPLAETIHLQITGKE
ncbi:MAG: hypothetical protein AB2593_18730 [Candidatus Thiodiazotropha sp.]|nr:MAG: hypothetical protein DBO99_02635 [gamma proteobacterium symbiont of Ctena orbiculata]